MIPSQTIDPVLDPVLALRPFVPAKSFDRSRLFYQRLGFVVTHADKDIVMLKQGSFSFILQNFYVQELADNFMLQLLVRDSDAWWHLHVDGPSLVSEFGVKVPRPPSIQSWGMKVGFIFDPSGVLWHIAEVPF
jgi:hypothetical protein